RLTLLAERNGVAGGRVQADLLAELAPRGGEGVVGRLVLALGDRPRAGVLPRPERATRVREEDLDRPVVRHPVQQKPGAPRDHASKYGSRRSPGLVRTAVRRPLVAFC